MGPAVGDVCCGAADEATVMATLPLPGPQCWPQHWLPHLQGHNTDHPPSNGHPPPQGHSTGHPQGHCDGHPPPRATALANPSTGPQHWPSPRATVLSGPPREEVRRTRDLFLLSSGSLFRETCCFSCHSVSLLWCEAWKVSVS